MATFRKGHHARAAHRNNTRQIQRINIPDPEPTPTGPKIVGPRITRAKDETDLLSRTLRGRQILQLLHDFNRTCYLCGDNLETDYQIDHIIPRSQGGTDDPRNYALACRTCNSRKRDLIVSFTVKDRTPIFALPGKET